MTPRTGRYFEVYPSGGWQTRSACWRLEGKSPAVLLCLARWSGGTGRRARLKIYFSRVASESKKLHRVEFSTGYEFAELQQAAPNCTKFQNEPTSQ